jgi:hypothetical protein
VTIPGLGFGGGCFFGLGCFLVAVGMVLKLFSSFMEGFLGFFFMLEIVFVGD